MISSILSILPGSEQTLEKIAAAASKKKLKPLVWLMTPDGRSAHKTTVAFSQAIEELQKMSTEVSLHYDDYLSPFSPVRVNDR
jgi:hypothetical protein